MVQPKKLDSRYLTENDFWFYVIAGGMLWQGYSFWWVLAVAAVYWIYQGFRDDPKDED